MTNKIEKRYTADFETLVLTDEEIKQGKSTYVWAWALCNIDTLKTIYGTDIASFFTALGKLKSGSILYFHNLKFDGNFIMSYMLKNSFKKAISHRNMGEKEYIATVSELGTWYSIKLKINNKNITIYDSLKKLPFSVDQLAKQLGLPEEKGHIDYKAFRQEGDILSDEDKDYIRRDVEIVARALKEVCFSKDMFKMTIGADCMELYKNMTPKFKEWFPVLSPDVDQFCRHAYKGGYCYINKNIAGKLIENVKGCTHDFNSMYPSQMHSNSGNYFPVGQPEYYTGDYKRDVVYPLYIQHFKAIFTLKSGYVPTVQIKDNAFYRENEYIENVEEIVELYMTNVDFDIFWEHYDVIYYEPIDGFKFQCLRGLFDEYINYWYKYKEEATINKDKVGRLVAKLALNNLYGKFGTNPDSTTQDFYIDDNGLVKHHNIYDEKDSVYVPVAAWITSYGRKELITAIQQNYDTFCYCDSDSIHTTTEDVKGLKVHDSALGYWKKESTWDKAKFIRQKTYAEFINGEWDIKAAGASAEVKENMTDINEFKIGASYPGRKTVKKVKGGIVLVDCNFTII